MENTLLINSTHAHMLMRMYATYMHERNMYAFTVQTREPSSHGGMYRRRVHAHETSQSDEAKGRLCGVW